MPVTAAAEKGLKRICPSCGTRYYDLNKRPVNCPSCATEFTGELKIKSRRGRVAAIADDEAVNSPATAAKKGAANDGDEDIEVVEGEEDTISLEDVEAVEEADADEVDADLDIDDDVDDIDEDLDEDDALEVEPDDDKV